MNFELLTNIYNYFIIFITIEIQQISTSSADQH